MTHLVLPVVAAFLAAPLAPGKPGFDPDRKADLPLVFVVFCALCMGLMLCEALWPPLPAALSTLDMTLVSQL